MALATSTSTGKILSNKEEIILKIADRSAIVGVVEIGRASCRERV